MNFLNIKISLGEIFPITFAQEADFSYYLFRPPLEFPIEPDVRDGWDC
jgi:hypothetical protein